jgi:hypothetical protein
VRWLRARVYCEGMSVGLAKLMRSLTAFFIVARRSRRGGFRHGTVKWREERGGGPGAGRWRVGWPGTRREWTRPMKKFKL